MDIELLVNMYMCPKSIAGTCALQAADLTETGKTKGSSCLEFMQKCYPCEDASDVSEPMQG